VYHAIATTVLCMTGQMLLFHAELPKPPKLPPAQARLHLVRVASGGYFVEALAAVASLNLSPSSISGGSGTIVVGTITLSSPAPSDTTVNLSSSNPALAAVPVSVVVPAGSTWATFSVVTNALFDRAYGRMNPVTITAGTASATLSVSAAPPPASWSIGTNNCGSLPAVCGAGGSKAVADAVWTSSCSGSTRTFTFNRGCPFGCVYQAGSDVCASSPPVATLFFDPPVVLPGQSTTGIIELTAPAPSGGRNVELRSDRSDILLSTYGFVTIPAGQSRATYTVTNSVSSPGPVFAEFQARIVVSDPSSSTVTTIFRQGWLTVTPPVTPPAPDIPLPSVQSLVLNPTSVAGGSNSQGTIALSSGAPQGGAVVSLMSLNPGAASVPASVMVLPGATTATFTATTPVVSVVTQLSILATYNATNQSAVLTVTPPAAPSPPPPTTNATLTVTATGRSGERVTSSPAGINIAVGSSGSASFDTSTQITLSVTNGRDAIWSGACSSGGNKTKTCTFTLTGAATIAANVQ